MKKTARVRECRCRLYDDEGEVRGGGRPHAWCVREDGEDCEKDGEVKVDDGSLLFPTVPLSILSISQLRVPHRALTSYISCLAGCRPLRSAWRRAEATIVLTPRRRRGCGCRR
jgi:hypothetical protein